VKHVFFSALQQQEEISEQNIKQEGILGELADTNVE